MFVPKCHLPPKPLTSKYFRKERERHFTKFWRWLSIILLFCPFTTRPACALKIISNKKYYYVTKESSVTLGCEFAFASDNLKHMEIEWNIVPPNREEDDKIIIWLTAGVLYRDLYPPLKGRVHFTSPDPQNGDASLAIKDLGLTDTGIYQCKVKLGSGIDMKNIFLTVMERPSKPVCYVEGEAAAGERVELKCRSSQGSLPLKYRWSKTSGNQMLHRDAFVDIIGGTLYLPEITEQDCGTYLCTVESLVGEENCEVTLSITSAQTTTYRLEPMAATVPTAVVVIIAAITAVICFCRRKKKKEESFSNEILEDELPPQKWHRRAQGCAQRHLVVSNVVDEGFKKNDNDRMIQLSLLQQTTLMRRENVDRRLHSEDTYTHYETIDKEFGDGPGCSSTTPDDPSRCGADVDDDGPEAKKETKGHLLHRFDLHRAHHDACERLYESFSGSNTNIYAELDPTPTDAAKDPGEPELTEQTAY